MPRRSDGRSLGPRRRSRVLRDDDGSAGLQPATRRNTPVGLSAVGTAVRYNATSFTVGLAGTYVFQSQATNPANWDNYTFLYANSFNPASPLVNALTGNDDNPSIGLSGFSLALSAGTTYLFVTTGFSNTDFGAFTNTISGPGIISLITAVPEPSPIALSGVLAALGFGGRYAARRLKRQAA